jgi:hypothetical protein
MKKIIVILLTGIMMTAFSVNKTTLVAETMTELHGYTLRNNNVNLHDFNLWVITNEETFNNEFVAETDQVIKPQFETQLVLAAKVVTQSSTYQVKFREIVVDRNTLNVYFSVKRDRPEVEKPGQLAAAAVAKNHAVKKVNFYHDKVLVKSVPIVSVY